MATEKIQGMGFRFDFDPSKNDFNIFVETLPFQGQGFELHDAPGNKMLHDQDVEALGLHAQRMVPWSNTILAPKIVLVDDQGQKREVRDAVVFWSERDALSPSGRRQRCTILISSFFNDTEARAAMHRCVFEAIEYRMTQNDSAETILNLSTMLKANRDPVVAVMERHRKAGEVHHRRNAFAVAAELRVLTGIKLFTESDNPIEQFFATILDGSLGAQLAGGAVDKGGLPKIGIPTATVLAEARDRSAALGRKSAVHPNEEVKAPASHDEAVTLFRRYWGGK